VVTGPYLLDTSTLLWAVGSPERLSAPARKALIRGPLLLSVVSYWEIVIKAQKGALKIADPANWWSRATEQLGGAILSIRVAHVSALAALPAIHKDPFDRMLIAQTAVEGVAFISSDERIGKYAVKVVW
jgi:PIN domain nuclease of toxin-antitoxin system